MNQFNPVFEIGNPPHQISMTLYELCNDAGLRAYRKAGGNEKGNEAYHKAYNDLMKKLMPDHPSLIDEAL